ncbi:hypothetical protein Btru_059053 [Bulinus truncatus]|nr:hypothetical protein Btru_059053 [Bulinus truncatus]
MRVSFILFCLVFTTLVANGVTRCVYSGTIVIEISSCILVIQTAEGITFIPTPCKSCTCHKGQLTCAIQDCALPQCEAYTTPPGQCCPVWLET